jgi:hypothetical protein
MRGLRRLRSLLLWIIAGAVLGLPACGSSQDGDAQPMAAACVPFEGSAAKCYGSAKMPLLCTSEPNGVCVGDAACQDLSALGATPCKTVADCPKVDLAYPQPHALDPKYRRTAHCDVGYCAEYACMLDSGCAIYADICPGGGICTPGDSTGFGGRATCITPI